MANQPVSVCPWVFQCPKGWSVIQQWGDGYALRFKGLRVLVDCSEKSDGNWWIHVSVSRKNWVPSHADMALVKEAFIGADRYAYSVWAPEDNHVNVHPNCLHLWALAEGDGRVLPEFSDILPGIGRSI